MDVTQTLLIVGLVAGFGFVMYVIARSRTKERAEREQPGTGSAAGGSSRPVQKK